MIPEDLSGWLAYALIAGLGLVGGLLSGMLGIGGGWLLTPGLNMLGFPMPQAVAITLSQMVGSGLIGTIRHHMSGNFNLRLSLPLAMPMMIGVYVGKELMLYMRREGLADFITGKLFVVIMLLMAFYSFRKNRRDLDASKGQRSNAIVFVSFICLPIGVLSGILGLGGGFFLVPILTYFLAVPAQVASACSLGAIFLSSLTGSVSYGFAGLLTWQPVFVLTASAVLGAYAGAGMCVKIDGYRLRRSFSWLVLASALARFTDDVNNGKMAIH